MLAIFATVPSVFVNPTRLIACETQILIRLRSGEKAARFSREHLQTEVDAVAVLFILVPVLLHISFEKRNYFYVALMYIKWSPSSTQPS